MATIMRPKADRARAHRNTSTLDQTHRKYISGFSEKKRALPQKRKELIKKRKKLEKLEKKSSKEYTNNDIRMRSQLKDDIEKLVADIDDIENNRDEMEYYDLVSESVIDYYSFTDMSEIIEEHAPEDENKIEIKPISQVDHKQDQLDLANAKYRKGMKIRPHKPPKKRRPVKPNTDKNILDYISDAKPKKMSKENMKQVVGRATLNKQYRMMIGGENVNYERTNTEVYMCEDCGVERLLVPHEGMCVCPVCAEAEYIMIETERAANKDTMTEKPG